MQKLVTSPRGKYICMGCYWCCLHCSTIIFKVLTSISISTICLCTNILVLQCQYHQYIGATYMVAPIYWWNCVSCTNRQRNTIILLILRFADFVKCLQHQYIGASWSAAPIYLCNTKRIKMLGSTAPIRLNEAYSICWSGAETETHVFNMAVNFREKRTSNNTSSRPPLFLSTKLQC